MYHPYGTPRYTEGTLPTDFTFTGQRAHPGLGLMYYRARYYHPALGRFVSADTIVPEPANPQNLNRFAYVLGNPLKYTDPTGKYSEEEIMTAFGVSTWDEVLAFFKAGGSLEGKWGWLEILRKANNSDWILGRIEGGYALEGGLIRFQNGKITIGDVSQIEFGLRHTEYSLSRPVRGGVYYFWTDDQTMYFHPHLIRDPRPLRERPEDEAGLAQDIVSIFLDILSAGGFGVGQPKLGFALQFVQIAVDVGSATEGAYNYFRREQNVGYDSDDVLGAIGWIPWLGSVPDLVSVISHATGYRVVWTP